MSYPTTWQPPRFFTNPSVRYAVIIAVLGYFLLSYLTLEVDWQRTLKGIPRAVDIFQRMFPPNFSRWEILVRGVLESVQMALAASFFGMIIAIPVGLCAANNLVPKPVYYAGRAFLGISRTFHEVIVAIFFVKIFGFGPLAGVLTLIVASFSFIGKMIAEDIENMRPGKLEAIKATGASFPKLLLYAVQPHILPRYIGVSIYRLDANIRHSTVVGIVGAGGIGQTLAASFSRYDYGFSLAILMTIVSLVFLGEFFSNWIRAKLR
ncbi:MAG: phosphonate ABC transporter, permease protein PhnE [Desulfofustis sp.]|nr:phosphonate ABC transporter, permease protein PhnE [Desulfofustis sp.]NNF47171.1 phosphonate ABC transporter, permease protein PhnE [Desulfofustis sp.]NNK56515.1 phosphonate ABC transporter, permease protein PhnE [Desulfofustis sp.]